MSRYANTVLPSLKQGALLDHAKWTHRQIYRRGPSDTTARATLPNSRHDPLIAYMYGLNAYNALCCAGRGLLSAVAPCTSPAKLQRSMHEPIIVHILANGNGMQVKHCTRRPLLPEGKRLIPAAPYCVAKHSESAGSLFGGLPGFFSSGD